MLNQFDKYAIASDSRTAATMLHSAHSVRSAHHRTASVAQNERHLGHLHTLPATDTIACGRPKCTPIVADTITAIAISIAVIFSFLLREWFGISLL